MEKDNQGLLMHILPGWVFCQQIQCTLAYIIKFTGEINLVFTRDVTLYVQYMKISIWGASPKIIKIKTS